MAATFFTCAERLIEENSSIAETTRAQTYADWNCFRNLGCSPPQNNLSWFSNFRETLIVSKIANIQYLADFVRESSRLAPDEDSQMFAALLARRSLVWDAQAQLRKANLVRQFPSGISSLRAVVFGDPIAIKHCVCDRDENETVSSSMLGPRRTRYQGSYSSVRLNDDGGETPVAFETLSKRSQIPDLRCHSNTIYFCDTNRKVNPEIELGRERVNLWTLDEVRIFLERFIMYYKNFKRISAHLCEKSDRDVADFYYRFKISLGLKVLYNELRKKSSNTSTLITIALQSFREISSINGLIPQDSYKIVSVPWANEVGYTHRTAGTEDIKRCLLESIIAIQNSSGKRFLPPLYTQAAQVLSSISPEPEMRPLYSHYAIPLPNK